MHWPLQNKVNFANMGKECKHLSHCLIMMPFNMLWLVESWYFTNFAWSCTYRKKIIFKIEIYPMYLWWKDKYLNMLSLHCTSICILRNFIWTMNLLLILRVHCIFFPWKLKALWWLIKTLKKTGRSFWKP